MHAKNVIRQLSECRSLNSSLIKLMMRFRPQNKPCKN